MGIELGESSITAKKTYSGNGVFTVAAGKTLKIETTPDGDDILEEEVPVGKVWRVSININIDEVDA